MSGQGSKFREEQVLIICPGSQTTLAQMGCNELTPPQHRFPTRMFPSGESSSEEQNQQSQQQTSWRPFHTFSRINPKTGAEEWVEDVDSLEGAVYPIQGGHITNMDAFLAFLEHVHSVLTTTYHNTPIMLMASPQWTRRDCEAIARYIFEKTKTPALCMIHSGVATQYGLKWPHLTVVDVGYEKVDVTCIYEGRVVAHKDVGAKPDDEDIDEDGSGEFNGEGISGGEVFTRRLMELLKDQDFDHEMAEQLKKSNVCEVLPYVPDAPELMELPTAESAAATAASVPVVVTSSGEGPMMVTTSTAPATAEDIDATLNGEDKVIDEEGVLDVANIVASGNTREFLAKQEKLKAEKAKAGPGRKGKGQESDASAAAKPVRLPNSKRVKAIFHYEESITEDVPIAPPVTAPPKENGAAAAPAAPKDVEMAGADAAPAPPTEGEDAKKDDSAPKPEDGAVKEETKPEEQPKPESAPTEPTAEAPAAAAQEEPVPTERVTRKVRRDIEVGLERFLFADRKEIDRIVTTIYRTIQNIDDMYMRPSCWENVVFVGNGARIRGLRDNIMQTLQSRHLISPSSATMFTSELPSNIGTPTGTGSQTPTSSFAGPSGPQGGVNPLLQAATAAASLQIPGQQQPGEMQQTHHFHSQTPTQIKLAPLPTYLQEWTKNGFEESMFLGAQVAARLAFCIHNLDAQGVEAQRLMSLSRVEYNELGPKGIRSHSMLF
ncbi:hypothetical protein QBC35DRAFT_462136 [Podospora australis]|uniref:SWI/SNF and RSC complexes subunit arp9 n=1 Tax=Podospora australis TaxID=1536484 RepID=A0AAN6WW56_9PEZI|nr:hypothetical protein QBC35DRAFT_462136 [Podospora australis]